MIEREIKALLTEEMYEKIMHHERFNNLSKISHMQVNYYYDTPDFMLYHAGVTLRVRQHLSSLKLEMKYPIEEKGIYKVKREISKPITHLPLTFEIQDAFEGLPYKGKVTLIQPLVTQRTRIQYHRHIRIDLDQSSYLGITDYEMEIEFHQGEYEEAVKLCKSLIPIDENQVTLGKNARFFQQYFKLIELGGK